MDKPPPDRPQTPARRPARRPTPGGAPAALGNLEALLAEIGRQATRRALELERDARERAEQRLAEAQQQAEALRRERRQQAQREQAAIRRQELARGELEAQRRLLLAREGAIERVWQEAERQLRELLRPEQAAAYLQVLGRLAVLAARELALPQLELAADPAGHALLTHETLEHWSARAGVKFERADAPADCWGGLVAQQQRFRYDASFGTRLELARERLREDVVRRLRGASAADAKRTAAAEADETPEAP